MALNWMASRSLAATEPTHVAAVAEVDLVAADKVDAAVPVGVVKVVQVKVAQVKVVKADAAELVKVDVAPNKVDLDKVDRGKVDRDKVDRDKAVVLVDAEPTRVALAKRHLSLCSPHNRVDAVKVAVAVLAKVVKVADLAVVARVVARVVDEGKAVAAVEVPAALVVPVVLVAAATLRFTSRRK